MPTLRELLEEGKSFKYGTDYNKVETDSDTLPQNLLEFETQGIRPKFTIRQPLLYGTQTLRITRRSTGILDDMKENRTNLEGGKDGLLGGVISKAKETLNDLGSKLKIPTLQIPTRVTNNSDFKGTDTSKIPETLAKIREDAAGSLVGKFLKQNAQGTPKQVGRQAIGGGIGLAKEELRKKVFGVGGEPNLSPSAEETINNKPSLGDFTYSNLKPYSKSIKVPGFEEFGLRFNLETIQDKKSWTRDFVNDKVRTSRTTYADPTKQDFNFPQFSVESITQNIPDKRDKTNTNNFYLNKDSVLSEYRIDKNKYGKFRTTRDAINSTTVWEGVNSEGQSPGDNPPIDKETGKLLDELDFLPFRFYSVAKNLGVSFKATLNGITENFSPSWETSNFIGNPFNFYNYQSIDRDLTFSFTVYSLNALEHRKNWERLDFLASLVYPQNLNSRAVYVTPPLLKFTMGNMYKNKLGFIESLSYTIDDNTPWELGFDVKKTGNRITDITDKGLMKNYKLPTIINVAVSYQIIESSSDAVNTRLYSYGDFETRPTVEAVDAPTRGVTIIPAIPPQAEQIRPQRLLENPVPTPPQSRPQNRNVVLADTPGIITPNPDGLTEYRQTRPQGPKSSVEVGEVQWYNDVFDKGGFEDQADDFNYYE